MALSIRFQIAAFSSSESPHNQARAGRHALLVSQGVGGQVEPRPRQLDAFLREKPEVETGPRNAAPARAGTPGLQDLLDRLEQSVAVLQHDAVELAPFLLVQLAALQSLQVEPNRRHRSLELVGDGVDEGIVLLVAADFAHQEDGVEHHPGNDRDEQDDAEDEQERSAPVEHDPADVERDGQRHEADAQDGEEDDRPTPAADHANRIMPN